LAIAVDNLADADSLTDVEKEEEVEAPPKSHSPTPILGSDEETMDEDTDGEKYASNDETDEKIHLDDGEEYDEYDGQYETEGIDHISLQSECRIQVSFICYRTR
jgi:voltage-dependent calcium channel L type alpha-1D